MVTHKESHATEIDRDRTHEGNILHHLASEWVGHIGQLTHNSYHHAVLWTRSKVKNGATEPAKNTKPHMALGVTPPVDLKSYLRTNTNMLCAHHMPL